MTAWCLHFQGESTENPISYLNLSSSSLCCQNGPKDCGFIPCSSELRPRPNHPPTVHHHHHPAHHRQPRRPADRDPHRHQDGIRHHHRDPDQHKYQHHDRVLHPASHHHGNLHLYLYSICPRHPNRRRHLHLHHHHHQDRHLLFLACRTMPYRHGHGNGLQELLRPAVHDYEYHHQAMWVPGTADGECEFPVWRGGCV